MFRNDICLQIFPKKVLKYLTTMISRQNKIHHHPSKKDISGYFRLLIDVPPILKDFHCQPPSTPAKLLAWQPVIKKLWIVSRHHLVGGFNLIEKI